MNTLFALSLLVACVQDVGEGKAKAEVTEPPPAEAAAPAEKAAPAGAELAIDAGQSKIEALGAKITATHPVAFHDWNGTVTVDGDNVTDLQFTVQMASLESDHPKLTEHLKNEDFFDVTAHPTATFDAAEIKAGGEGEGVTHTVSGDLTIKGKTLRVTFPATVEVGADAVKANSEFTINRQDFGITYPGRPDDLVQDNVVLTVAIVAPRA